MTRTPSPLADDARPPSSRAAALRQDPAPATSGRQRAPIEVALDTAGLKIISLDDYADGADDADGDSRSTSH